MDNIEILYTKFPEYVRSMMFSSHHADEGRLNPYHLEGDVWTHTCLVYNVAKMNGFPHISQVIALLHDIGKPFVRHVDENGKTWFTGHESVSMFRAIDLIYAFDLSIYEQFLALLTIGRHRDLYSYLKSDMKESKLISRFRNKDLFRLLITQTFCDHHGRIYSNGNNTRITRINRIRDLLKLVDLINEEEQNTNNKEPEIVVLVGPPLSGKSTFATLYYPNHEYLSRDDIVVELAPTGLDYTEAFKKVDQSKVDEVFYERFRNLVKNGKNIIVDKTHMTKRSRNATLSFVNGHYHKKAVVFLVGYAELMKRNRDRFYETGKYIPDHVIDRMISSFSFPLHTHFDEIEYVYNDLVFNEMNSSPLYKY